MLNLESNNKKISRIHVQIIVRVFGGVERVMGGEKTYLKQKKGSLATLFLFYLPSTLLLLPGDVAVRGGEWLRWWL